MPSHGVPSVRCSDLIYSFCETPAGKSSASSMHRISARRSKSSYCRFAFILLLLPPASKNRSLGIQRSSSASFSSYKISKKRSSFPEPSAATCTIFIIACSNAPVRISNALQFPPLTASRYWFRNCTQIRVPLFSRPPGFCSPATIQNADKQ